MTQLDDWAAEVSEDQAAIEAENEDTRTRVKRMGKLLLKMQKTQKKEQAETGQTWQEWCEEKKVHVCTFPGFRNCKVYMLIAKYPRAFEKGMTIQQAYKMAGEWKKNAGNPPEKMKVTVSSRRLVTIGRMAGRLEDKVEKVLEKFEETKEEEGGWSNDELIGCQEQLQMTRQSINLILKRLSALILKEGSRTTR